MGYQGMPADFLDLSRRDGESSKTPTLGFRLELSAEWTSSEPSGQERDCSPVPCPPPQSRRQKKTKIFFLRARLLNAQRSPGFGHENGIIHHLFLQLHSYLHKEE
jgi:hypothetical protein